MTVVVAGVHPDGWVTMAADSGLTFGASERITTAQKLLTYTDYRMVIGFSGRPVIGVAAREAVTALLSGAPVDPDGWAQQFAVDVTRRVVEAGALMDVEGNREMSGAILLARDERLWRIDHNIAMPINDPVAAIGGGCDYALGSMHTQLEFGIMKHLRNVDWSVLDACLVTAVRAACYWDRSCFGPIVTATTKRGV